MEFGTSLLWELLYGDDLVLVNDSMKGVIEKFRKWIEKFRKWKDGMESEGV